MAAANAALRDGRLCFPLVIKLRWGTASLGVEFVADEMVLVQQAFKGQEYGIDILDDLPGARHAAIVAARQLR